MHRGALPLNLEHFHPGNPEPNQLATLVTLITKATQLTQLTQATQATP
jgi:hypothetical protein